MAAVLDAAPLLGVVASCDALDVSRATWYRRMAPQVHGPKQRPASARRLPDVERDAVLAVLHEERFAERAPAEIYATLLDEDRYLCSVSTMYRILHDHEEVRERRDQRRHPSYAPPVLLAEKPNQLWSWDITKLKGPRKWHYFHLYVIMDVYSRFIVGWMVAHRETAVLAERLIETSVCRQAIPRGQLTLHADRGTSMRSKTVAQLLVELGVEKTHSRPRVSDDNPYSESGFKTMKSWPGFPRSFGTIEDARAHVMAFIDWYNNEHRHEGIAYLTPSQIHHGQAEGVLAERQLALDRAHIQNPMRFPNGPPRHPALPRQVWINRPPAPAEAIGLSCP